MFRVLGLLLSVFLLFGGCSVLENSIAGSDPAKSFPWTKFSESAKYSQGTLLFSCDVEDNGYAATGFAAGLLYNNQDYLYFTLFEPNPQYWVVVSLFKNKIVYFWQGEIDWDKHDDMVVVRGGPTSEIDVCEMLRPDAIPRVKGSKNEL